MLAMCSLMAYKGYINNGGLMTYSAEIKAIVEVLKTRFGDCDYSDDHWADIAKSIINALEK